MLASSAAEVARRQPKCCWSMTLGLDLRHGGCAPVRMQAARQLFLSPSGDPARSGRPLFPHAATSPPAPPARCVYHPLLLCSGATKDVMKIMLHASLTLAEDRGGCIRSFVPLSLRSSTVLGAPGSVAEWLQRRQELARMSNRRAQGCPERDKRWATLDTAYQNR